MFVTCQAKVSGRRFVIQTDVLTTRTHLLLGLGFLHVVSADLDPGREDGPSELHHVHPKEMAEFLCN